MERLEKAGLINASGVVRNWHIWGILLDGCAGEGSEVVQEACHEEGCEGFIGHCWRFVRDDYGAITKPLTERTCQIRTAGPGSRSRPSTI